MTFGVASFALERSEGANVLQGTQINYMPEKSHVIIIIIIT